DYFHLVDKQDFNAPIAFKVNTRAWYERLPKSYRNLVDKDGDGTVDYNSSSAWEGIVLPFTATKVTAEKNGEITHFYGKTEGGDHTLHHEYWLTGMVDADGDKATFARPAVSGDGLFVEDNQTKAKRNYTYQANSYFTSLFNYGDHYNTRDEDGDETFIDSDEEWYANSHTFTDYVPLTAEVPYIVAFPGNDFYEFSMESFYHTNAYGKEEYKQKATFESVKPDDASIAASIGISDNSDMTTTVGTHNHTGTYLHQTDKMGINATGTAFEANQPILPFRTYMTVSASSAPIRTIIISDGYSSLSDEEDEDPQEEMVGAEELRIWGDGLEIVVETACVRTLNVYASDGSLREVLHCQPGVNRFAMKNGGLYMVGRVKLLLK
ncbi:MAG: hypothetical protein MJY79_05430, partial [Bacteroidaceae bacterium]|nr:hypothetical protein [Bacteroidaceae bacterium]